MRTKYAAKHFATIVIFAVCHCKPLKTSEAHSQNISLKSARQSTLYSKKMALLKYIE
jgi:hypothetical protein